MKKGFRITRSFVAPVSWSWGYTTSGEMTVDLLEGVEMEVAEFIEEYDGHQWAVMAFGRRRGMTISFGLKAGCWTPLPERVVVEPDPGDPGADPVEVADGVADFLAALSDKVKAAGGPANFWGAS